MPDIVGGIMGAITFIFSTPIHLVYVVLGVLFGMLLGLIPGLGGATALALLIPLTFGMDPMLAFMILASAQGGANFGGSITAILINTPGSSVNAATVLDGYPMARDGRADEALGASAAASATGAIVGFIFLVLTIPILIELLLLFATPEVFWLGVLGLTVIAVVVKGSVIAGISSAAFGVLFAMHGLNQSTTTIRWTYGIDFLIGGLGLIPPLIGLFAVGEMIHLISEGESISGEDTEVQVGFSGVLKGVVSVWVHKYLFLRSAIIGILIGIVPGVGGSAANPVAYFNAVQTAKDPESFGTGDVRGVIAAEASNDAKDGGALIPTLGFGIPGSVAMAILLGAFVLHGITPGPLLIETQFSVVAIILVSLLISNILTSLIGISIATQLVKLTKINVYILAPIILVMALFGTYAIASNIHHVFIATFFGILGFAMVKVNMSRVPMVLGIILGPIVEKHFFRTLQLGRGDYSIFYESTVAKILIFFVLVSLGLPFIRKGIRETRKKLAL